MIPRTNPSAALIRLAEAQAGVLTTEQADALGFHETQVRRVVGEGRWQRLMRGVYFTHDTPPPWLALAWAGALTGGDRAVLSLESAAHLIGFAPEPGEIDIHVPATSGHRSTGSWRFHRLDEVPRGSGMPTRTMPTRTVLDLCRRHPDRQVHWVTEAVGGRHTTIAKLRRELGTFYRFPHRATMELLLADVGMGAHSPLEVIYLRDVERAHGLPSGHRQARRGAGLSDVYYDEGLVVELDGRRGHEGRGRFRDMQRDNFHMRRGTPTLRYGWDECTRSPCLVAREVSSTLISLGSPHLPQTCRSCRALAA